MTDHKLLPRMPTEEMAKALYQYLDHPGYITHIGSYQAMFDAAPAAEMPGLREMVEKAAGCIIGHSYDGNPYPLGQHSAATIFTAARVPELLARVHELDRALRYIIDWGGDAYINLRPFKEGRDALGEKK